MVFSWFVVLFGEYFKELEFLEYEDISMGNRKLTAFILSLKKAEDKHDTLGSFYTKHLLLS